MDWGWGWNMFPRLLLQDRLGWMMEWKLYPELEWMRLGGDWGLTMLHDPNANEETLWLALRYDTNDNDTIPCLIRCYTMSADEDDPNEMIDTIDTIDTNATKLYIGISFHTIS